MFTFPEVRDWLLAAGFSKVHGFSGHGEGLTIDAPRMVIAARWVSRATDANNPRATPSP